MATITPANAFDPVYLLDTTDPVKGGAVVGPLSAPTDGQANAQAQALANRTEYLRQKLLPIGSVIMWAGSSVPSNYFRCDGSTKSRTTYADLFSAIGIQFGEGNGTTTFNLPDFRGLFPRGYDAGAGNDPDAASRTAMNTGGNTGDAIGSVQDDAVEAHSHVIDRTSGIGSGTNPTVADSTEVDDTPNQDMTTGSFGGSTETRPKNFSIDFIIKYA